MTDWTRPPYYHRGVLRVVLEGEDPASIPTAEIRRRLVEYHELLRAEWRARPPYFADSLARVAEVFGSAVASSG